MTSVFPHKKAKALKPSSRRPAKELCSECGLCDTYYVHYVKDACAFLHQQIAELEAQIHDRSRNLDNPDEWYFGVSQNMMAARKTEPIPGAQWTGIVSTIAIEMLTRGMVEGVVCVQNTEDDRFQPKPVLARTPAEILAAMRLILETEHWVIEGAAAVAVAAYLKDAARYQGKTAAIVICGRNVSPDVLRRLL